MSTFTLTGLGAVSGDNGVTTSALDASTLELFLPDTAVPSFRYTLEDDGSPIFPEIDDLIINAIDIRLDGVSLDDDRVTANLGEVQWAGNATTVLVLTDRSVPGSIGTAIFTLGGTALPAFATPAEYDAFLDTGVTGTSVATGAFAPGALIALADLPGIVESPLPDSVAPNLSGSDGDDDLFGEIGDDDISGGSGNDHLSGNDGDDDLAGEIGDDSISGGSGHDNLSGDDGDDDLAGDIGDDNISGGSGKDHLSGDDGDDDLFGDDGDDDISGGLGHDRLFGGAGNNRLLGDDGDDILEGGDDHDTLNGGDGDDDITGGLGSGDLGDLIFAGAGNDHVDGGYGNDDINGMDGDDILLGGFGSDRMVGGTGKDVITGSALSDELFGNDDDDFINGGFGHDRVNGGAGGDKFFHLGIDDHGSDWIQDFAYAEGDVLLFGQAGATADQFQVNFANSGSGDAGVDEAFVIYKPTGQIIWALVDGDDQASINLQISGSGDTFDLMG
jgi:Ca2+-binding RTX toxin-like protein